jgi:WhiB family redox-sensing transcriptional regulator
MRPRTRAVLTATRPGAAPRATTLGWGDLGLTPESLAWHQHAACREVGTEVFFLESGANAVDIAAAKQICAGCPVRATCLADAIERGERFGIWGGLTERERRALGHRARPQSRTRAVTDVSVARLTRAGKSAREIATALDITVRTVTRSRARIRQSQSDATSVESRQEAA